MAMHSLKQRIEITDEKSKPIKSLDLQFYAGGYNVHDKEINVIINSLTERFSRMVERECSEDLNTLDSTFSKIT